MSNDDFELELCEDSDSDDTRKPEPKPKQSNKAEGKKAKNRYSETYNENTANERANAGVPSKMIGYDGEGDKIYAPLSAEEQAAKLADKVKELQKKKNALKRNLPDKLRERNAKLQAEIAELKSITAERINEIQLKPAAEPADKTAKKHKRTESVAVKAIVEEDEQEEEEQPEPKVQKKKKPTVAPMPRTTALLAPKFIQRR